jgi:hypothetical protein
MLELLPMLKCLPCSSSHFLLRFHSFSLIQIAVSRKLYVSEQVAKLNAYISMTNYDYESNQQDAAIQVNLLFLVSSTCFGRCFRQSSGALDCIYSIW